jgi:hypothetical protein
VKRESLSLQQREKISQKFPLEFEIEVTELRHFVTGLCQRSKFSLSQIGNIDGITIFFSCFTIILQISNGEKKWQ